MAILLPMQRRLPGTSTDIILARRIRRSENAKQPSFLPVQTAVQINDLLTGHKAAGDRMTFA